LRVLREDWEAAVEVLVDEHRLRCLWFLRPGYRASSGQDRLRLLRAIETHGDREAYRRAALLRAWLSQTSSGASAGS
jgi:hypothetical protein